MSDLATHPIDLLDPEIISDATLAIDGFMCRVTLLVADPIVATCWLDYNVRNRRVSPETVRQYALDVESGEWVLNGQTITFAYDAGTGTWYLSDGQHRLEGIIRAGVPAPLLVVSDIIDPRAQATTDEHRRRGYSNVLAIRGVENDSKVAAITRLALQIELTGTVPTGGQPGVTVAQLDRFLADHGPEIARAVEVGRAMQATKLITATLAGALHLHFARVDSRDADDFFRLFTTGVGLVEGSPILLLRSKLIGYQGDRNKPDRQYLAALVIKTWNAWRAGQTPRVLRWRAAGEEVFPRWD